MIVRVKKKKVLLESKMADHAMMMNLDSSKEFSGKIGAMNFSCKR